ncbi:MAG: hypothetical protein ACXW1W_07265 [Methylococcaceae bacterium]
MTNQTPKLDGQQLAKICKNTLPGQSDELLLAKIQALAPDYPVRLARTGSEWYRLGGIVDMNGKRIANDLVEWTERTFIECGKDLQTLIDYTSEQKLIATRQTGNTLYVVIQTGGKAEDFIQVDIDKTHEISDRLLVSDLNPPEDLEEFIDPLEPECIETFCIGTARYAYRRKTDVAVFMDEINKHHIDEHPVQRFMDDWNRSSAGQKAILSDDWIIRPFRHTGRFGQQIINVEIVNTQQKNIPQLEDITGKKGVTLQNLLARFDRQAGYSFAWFFYMVKGKLVSPNSGVAVFEDINGDFSYLPERDVAVLKDWVNAPYSV